MERISEITDLIGVLFNQIRELFMELLAVIGVTVNTGQFRIGIGITATFSVVYLVHRRLNTGSSVLWVWAILALAGVSFALTSVTVAAWRPFPYVVLALIGLMWGLALTSYKSKLNKIMGFAIAIISIIAALSLFSLTDDVGPALENGLDTIVNPTP